MEKPVLKVLENEKYFLEPKVSWFKYINLGNKFCCKKYNQQLYHVEYYDGK